MKKLLLVSCFIVVLVLISCASSSTAYVFDPEIPEDQMSFLWVPNYVKVKQFDNKTVEWIAPPLSMSPVKIGVPSGEYTFIIDTVITGSNTAGVPDISNKSYTKNFIKGKGYQLINRNGEIVLIDL
jgi:hypothetical protein